jgi:hypothetical protein
MASTRQEPSTQAGDGVDISARRARRAFPGRHVLLILAASMVLVIIAFLVSFATSPTAPGDQKAGNAKVTDPALVQQFREPEPAPKQPG